MNDKNISSLKGLEKFTNLLHLYANNNNISDISPLKNLSKLQYLLLQNNNIIDISNLKELTNITELQLENNKISDVSSLSNLTKLDRIFLSGNYVNNVSFLDNTKNITLAVLNNNVTNISLGQINQNSLKITKLPNIFIYAKTVGSKIYTKDNLSLTNCTISGNEIVLDTSKAGNITATVTVVGGSAKESSYKINYTVIEPHKPIEDLIFNVTYNSFKTTTGEVIVTITTNKQVKPVSGWNLSSDKLKLTKTYNENVNEKILLIDIDGITKTVSINISNIVLKVPDVQNPTEEVENNNNDKPIIDDSPKKEQTNDKIVQNADDNSIAEKSVKEKNMQVIITTIIMITIIICGLIYVGKHNN